MQFSKLIFVIAFTFLLPFKHCIASNEIGGEFEYEYVGSAFNLYKIRLILYQDCSKEILPSSVDINFKYTTYYRTWIVQLTRQTFPPLGNPMMNVTPSCSPIPSTQCDSPNSAIKGFQKYIYEGIIEFPLEGGIIDLTYKSCCRTLSNKYYNDFDTSFIIQARINLAILGTISSRFKNTAIPTICVGSPFNYSFNAITNDLDSLSYSLVDAQAISNSIYKYKSGYSTKRPFDILESIIDFDTTNGQMKFTPTSTGPIVLAVKVSKFRHVTSFVGIDSVIFISWFKRDIMLYVTDSCPPIFHAGILVDSVKNATVINNLKITVCDTGKVIEIPWRIETLNLPANAFLKASLDNTTNGWLGSNIDFSYTTKKDALNLSDTLWGLFKYKVPPKSVGCYPLVFNYEYCLNGKRIMGAVTYTVCFNDFTSPQVEIVSYPTFYCKSKPVIFRTKTFGAGYNPQFNWLRNGVVIGTNDTIKLDSVNQNDSIWCETTQGSNCLNNGGTKVFSSKKYIQLEFDTFIQVSIKTLNQTYTLGSLMKFEATSMNAGKNATYFWVKI